MAVRPVYRARVRAPRSIDPTELTVLTPVAGAAHSDPLQIATSQLLRPNLLLNPECATDLTGWLSGGSATLSRDTATYLNGVASCKVITTNAAASGAVIRKSGSETPATPGLSYVGSAHIEGSAAVGKPLRVQLQFLNAGLGILGTATTNFAALAGWQRQAIAGVAPTGTVYVRVRVDTQSAAGVFTYYVDSVQVEQATSLGVYNDAATAYRGYLQEPEARKTSSDPLTQKLKEGSSYFPVGDAPLTPGTNATRWLSAFLGDNQGLPQLPGCKWECELAEIDSATGVVQWQPWWVGRIGTLELARPQLFGINVPDMSRELKTQAFVRGRPHSSVTYARQARLWPLGLAGGYGNLPAGPVMTGTIGPASLGTGKSVKLDAASKAAAENVLTDALRSQDVPLGYLGLLSVGRIRYSTTVVAQLTWNTGANVADFSPGALLFQPVSANPTQVLLDVRDHGYEIHEILLQALTGGTALPADGTAVTVALMYPNAEPTKDLPLLLDSFHPVQYLADLLDGKFGVLLSDGSPRRFWPRKTSSFTALLADPTFGPGRRDIEKPEDTREAIESACRQFNIGWRLTPDGLFEIYDARLPTTLTGVKTVGSTDFIRAVPSWELSPEDAITSFRVHWYADLQVSPTEVTLDAGALIGTPASLIKPLDRFLEADDFGRADLGEEPTEIDCTCWRAGVAEVTNGIDRELYLRGKLLGMIGHYRSPYGYGPQTCTLLLHRNANTRDIQPGDLLLPTNDMLPNSGTNQRGGTRLVRVKDVNSTRQTLRVTVLDMGPNATLATPTIGALALNAGDPSRAIDVPVSLDAAGDSVRLEVAIANVASVNLVPDANWVFWYRVTSAGTLTIPNLPPGGRAWVRARSEPGSTASLALPSAWVYPAGADFIDLNASPAPTGLAVSQITQLGAKLTWTNTSTSIAVEILLVTPSTGTPASYIVLPPGTTSFVVPTTASATYKAAVRYWDGGAGLSPQSGTVTWTATGTPPVAPTPTACTLVDVLP